MRKTEDYSISFSDTGAIKEKYSEKKSHKLGVFDIGEALIAALVVITLAFTFVFRVVSVKGPSMKPTLQSGDRVVVSAIGYTPKSGDIIVLSGATNMKEPIVKRVIAVAGDTVDINFTTGVVTVNGEEEKYTDELTSQQFDIAFPITVPDGKVFVLGDNRGDSLDSRSTLIGCIDTRFIVGKVLFRFFPFGEWTVK